MAKPEIAVGGSEPAMLGVLRDAINRAVADGVSVRELARRSGVHDGGILRFSKAERDLKFESAARLAEVLGLELVVRRKKAKG